MKQIAVVVAVVFILIIGGGLTSRLVAEGEGSIFPTLKQVDDAEASVLQATPNQAGLLLIFIGAVVFNLVGIGITLAVIFWFVDRQIRLGKAEINPDEGQKVKAVRKL